MTGTLSCHKMPFSNVVNGVVLKKFPGANPKTPTLTRFARNLAQLGNFAFKKILGVKSGKLKT